MYTYDEVNDILKPTRKPQRRLIVFVDINKNKEFIEEIFKLGNFEIEKIDFSNNIFYVYFKNETITKEAFKWLEEYKEQYVKLYNIEVRI